MPSRAANCAMRAKLWNGMMPGTIGTSTPSAAHLVDEVEVGVGVEEELRDRRVGAAFTLSDEVLQVAPA